MKENIRAGEFLQENIQSPNGLLVRALINRLFNIYDDIPDEYVEFLSDLSKNTSVSGLLQPTSADPLRVLRVKL